MPQQSKEPTKPYIINAHQVIRPIQKATNPHTLAFLSLLRDFDEALIQSNPVGLAIVQLVGANAEIFQVMQLSQLPCDRERVVNGLIKINLSLPFKHCYMDMETMRWLDIDRLYSGTISKLRQQRENAYINYPVLTPCERDKDIKIRQLTALTGPLQRNEIDFIPALQKDSVMMAACKQIGVSPVADALAGAIERAKYLQSDLRRSLQ